jgi:glycosyltransferase involved in cell wall biosynthesis
MTRTSHTITSPRISVIISTYKAERFIRGCLEDLTSQTLFNKGQLELIVIDSNSPENEESIVQEFQAQYPSLITYIRTPEREAIYQAWNHGIQLANGRYLTNANADDRHRTDALEVMADYLDVHPDIALTYADCDVTTAENSRFGEAPVIAHFKWPDFQPVHLFQICHIGPQPMWRRSLHERHGLFDATYRSAGDYEFWLRLASRGEQFYHIPECLGLYLQSPSGVEHANQRLSWEESNRARMAHWPSNWGERPQPAGNYLIPVHAQTRPDKTPLVSVIMPTRNRPEFLARAIKSVLCQTYRNFEIVVVNDGGIDVQELIDHFNAEGNIRYFNLKNRIERSSVRNLAIKAAKGFYIAYLDDDDRYFPEHLEILVKHAQESGYRAVYSDAYRAQLNTSTGLPDETTRDVPYSLDFDPARIYVENFIPILCLMHERSCLDKSGMFDEHLSRLEDWDLWIRLSQVSRFHHIPQVTCEFTWHSGGSTQTLDNAPLFLTAYKAICKKHASISQQNASIRVWQQSNIYNKTCHTFEHVKQELFPHFFLHQSLKTADIPEKTANGFLERGIDANRIISTIYWIKSLAHDQDDSSGHWLHKALEADMENHPARLQLAALLVQQQRHGEAIIQLEKINEYNPVDVEIIRMLADLYMYKAHDTDRAAKVLNKGLWLFPDNSTLRAQLNNSQGI